MYQNKSILLPISFFIAVSFILSLISSVNADQKYDECAPVESPCGFPRTIEYPFWDSRLPEYCGHPAFKLECEDSSSRTITIKNQKYRILSINYDTKVVTIVKLQFLNGPCPSQKLLVNSTLDSKHFNFTSNSQNASLYYDCLRGMFGIEPPYGFPCSTSAYLGRQSTSNNNSLVIGYLALNGTWEKDLRLYCSFEIYLPILKSAGDELVNGESNIDKVLRKGFEVKWMIDDDDLCEECMNAGGRCGYNQTLNQTTCFCQDGANNGSCGGLSHKALPAPTSEPGSKKDAVALGAGIAVCLLLSTTLCLFLYRRHRKRDSSEQFLSHNKSYSPSSSKSDIHILTGSTYFGVHVFTYRELEVATEYFNPAKELGEGGFGTVYYGKLQDGREVAIKRLYENNNRRAEQFLNELEILANLRHRNLVNLYGCTSRQSRELLLVYEYVRNGTVADHLHGKQSRLGLLPWSTRLSIATETASALVYLHDSDIIHRDVKTQNILLDNDFSVKVADFGLSRLFPLDVTHVSTAPQGTPGYVDPEYYQCYQLTEKSDVYSFGVLLAELISSLPAVDITRRRNEINLSTMAINKIQNHALHELVDSSLGYESDFNVKKEVTAVAELCFECLQSTKDMRPSMNDVLKRLLIIQDQQRSEVDSAEVVDIPADDVLMLKGDFSPSSPLREEILATRYKPNASV